MNDIGKPERATQNRVVKLFCDELGYRYLGDWADRADNSNIEEGLLTEYLTSAGYTPPQISTALHKLRTEANHPERSLYGNNQAVYQLLRYGVPVKTEAGKATETVHLINWKEASNNHFAIAEEVTSRAIRLNTDLAKKPPECLEYIVGHELAHLIEPSHNARFVSVMNLFKPKWQHYRDELNNLPVRHKDWDY